jgi:biopolymer transport protein ExbB
MNSNIVERSKQILLEVGAAPIMYLMMLLSIVSVAIMIERGWFFAMVSENVAKLAHALGERLNAHDLSGASDLVRASKSAEAAIVAAGLKQLGRGVEAAEEAMASATALQRMRMGSISESLVATAIGLVVAIPAVAAFNYFQRRIRATLSNSDALTHILLAYAKGEAALPGGGQSSHAAARREATAREPSENFGMQRISTLPS